MNTQSVQFKKDLLRSLKIYIENNELKSFLTSDKYNFVGPFSKALANVIAESKNFYIFRKDLYEKKMKKKYSFETIEEKEIAEIFLKQYNLNSYLETSNKYKYFFKLLSYKVIILLITLLKKLLTHKKLESPQNIAFYLINTSDILRAKKIRYKNLKNIYFDKFYFFKKIFNLSFNKNFFFIDTFKSNKYLYIYKTWVSFFLIQQSIINIRPKLIISFEGDHYDHENIYLVAKSLKIKALCIQSATDLEKFQKVGFHNINQSKLLVWSKYYKNIYKKISPNLQTKVVGNYFIKKKKNSKKYIGIILQLKANDVSHKKFEEFKLLINWLCLNYKKKIIIRRHPYDINDDYDLKNLIDLKNIIIHDPNKILIGETLNLCSFIITKHSSAIVEAASIGVIPIIFAPMKLEKSIEALGSYDTPLIHTSINKMKTTINKLYDDEKKANKIKKDLISNFKNYINYSGNESLRRVNAEIAKLINTKV